MRIGRLMIAIVVVILIAAAISIFGQPKSYKVFVGNSSEHLVNKGRSYIFEKHMPDSALTCFSIVTNRFNPDMKQDEQAVIVEAYNRLWYLYFFVYFNYSEASNCLNKAAEISDGAGLSRERVDMNYGCMYMLLNEQSPDSTLSMLAADYLRKSFAEADAVDNEDVRQYAMANLLSLKVSESRIGDLTHEWESLSVNTLDRDSFIFTFNNIVYTLLNKIDNSQYDQALALLDSSLDRFDYSGDNIRCKYLLLLIKAKIFFLMQQYDACITTMHDLERLAMENDLTDSRLEIYRLLSDYLAHAGDSTSAYEYKIKHLVLKDSILNYHQLTNINELRFLGEIKDMQVELTKARYREKMSLYGMAGATLIIILSALFLVVLYNRNRRLNESNRSLYRKNEELLRQEISQSKPTDSVDIVKYSGSNIADEHKVEILNRTKKILRTSEEVYADDFCIARLATMVDVKEKVLSQVINELWGGNFVSLINHYRINEACRRITDINNFGNFTIESIGNSVGFKSRSAFIAAFKKQTGLTPSEYKRQANDIV